MGQPVSVILGVWAVFEIIPIIASYILFKKTRAISTLIIFIGYLLNFVPSIAQLVMIANDVAVDLTKIAILFSYITTPLITIGLLVYAVKLKRD